jgi:alpha/beta superfamily hydrolase
MCGMIGALVGLQTNEYPMFPAKEHCLSGQSPRAGFQRPVFLQGPAGRLEAVLNEGADSARFTALVCHPHPLGGGSLHNKVVYHAMKALNGPQWGFRAPVLRFNFRGAGLSEGVHDGSAEASDVRAALDWLDKEFHLPVVEAGFSFGAAMTLRACCGEARSHKNVRALALLGLPTEAVGRSYDDSFLQTCTIPKLFLSGERDQFAPATQLGVLAEKAAGPKQLVLVRDADHFFSGHLKGMQEALAAWLGEHTQ